MVTIPIWLLVVLSILSGMFLIIFGYMIYSFIQFSRGK